MTRYGRFDPINPENSSSMFVYQEVPLTSQKMNCWNGNLLAGFELLHHVCRTLLAKGEPAVMTDGSDDSLLVHEATTPDMTVSVDPGWAVLSDTLAGITNAEAIPTGGTFSAPVSNPRIDLIVLQENGLMNVVLGTEAANPVAPSVPDGALLLAIITQRVGATAIKNTDDGTQSYITDQRPKLLLGEAHRHEADRAPTESPDDNRTSFTTAQIYRAGTLDVYLNGVLQQDGVDYTEDADATGYTFLIAPKSHYRIQHRYIIHHEVI